MNDPKIEDLIRLWSSGQKSQVIETLAGSHPAITATFIVQCSQDRSLKISDCNEIANLLTERNLTQPLREPDPSWWTPEDRAIAQEDGWDIFDCSASDDGRWQLQAIMAPADNPQLGYDSPKFTDDRDAANAVRCRANAGDRTSQRAIDFLVRVNSGDVAKFGLLEYAEPGYLPGWPEDQPEFGTGRGHGDPSPGCGCGLNCARSPGDPCPIQKLEDLARRRGVTLDRLKRRGVLVSATLEETIRVLWSRKFAAAWTLLCEFGQKIEEQ